MTVQPMNNSFNTAFKGSYAKTENGAVYYKTNNGLKVGGTYGALGALGSLLPGESKIGGLFGLAVHSGIGAFIDYKRNKNAAEAADYIKQVGVKRALETRDDIYLSRNNGRPYYHSNVGAKYGTAIGASLGAILSILPSSILTAAGLGKLRSKEVAAGGILSFGVLTGMLAFGGFIMGKITDYFTNKNAERNA